MSAALTNAINQPAAQHVLKPLGETLGQAASFWTEVGCSVECLCASTVNPQIARVARMALAGLPLAIAIHTLPFWVGLGLATGAALAAVHIPPKGKDHPWTQGRAIIYCGLTCSDTYRVGTAALGLASNPTSAIVQVLFFGIMATRFSQKSSQSCNLTWGKA